MLHHGKMGDNRKLSGLSEAMSRHRLRLPHRHRRARGGALKVVLLTGLALLVLLFLGLFAVKTGVERYRNSQAFRDWVGARVATALKSDVDLASLRWEGATAFADGFRARGYEDAGLSGLEIDGLRATLGGAREGAWQVTGARASRLRVVFSPERLPGRYGAGREDAGDGASGPSAPAWLRRFLPDRFEIDQVEADVATLEVVGSDRNGAFALREVKTRLQPAAGGGWEIAGQGGGIVVPRQPAMDIDRFRVRWQGEEVFLNEAEIDLPDGGRVSVTGVARLVEGTDLDLDLAIAQLDLKTILNPEWRERTTGTLRGQVKVTGLASRADELVQSGTLSVDHGQVKNVPLLKTIARYTKSKQFERLTLNEATTRFERQGDRIRLAGLVVQSDGLARLEGDLAIDGGRLEGRFRLGITPGTLQWIPGAERKVFTRADRGFLWTDLTVSGTVDEPREDLTARLLVGAVESLAEDSPEKALEAVKGALRDPKATPETVIEEGKKALESLLPLLK